MVRPSTTLHTELNISIRWTSACQEYKNALAIFHKCKYRCALDKLEYLVVQWMFELAKLGISGTGYKLKEKIGKAFKAHSVGIRSALEEYNKHAIALKPPQQKLTWELVIEATSLAELDLLRDTYLDIQNRQVMGLFFEIERAEEEIKCLNVEIRRLC
ncbi:hypothetical protein BU17DRAFT_57697 [Hysterangium stoloniferum]|nr:hypothetical protein BU17DRAFT_57697 [Hysterangium stoloniferum]